MDTKLTRLIDNTKMFAIGAVAYTCTELLWRGHTHWTMTLTGGACALLIHLADKRLRQKRLAVRCLAGCGIITGMEFTVGCLVNILLGWGVWDYSRLPLNIMGQICLLYSAIWFLLSIPVIALSSLMERNRSNSAMIFA